MFKCEKCKQTPTHVDADGKRVGGRPNRVVVERKMVSHLGDGNAIGPRGGRGSQIVREVTVCDACLAVTPEAPRLEAEIVAEVRRPFATVGDTAEDAA